jgi:hypothetical protein
VNELSTPYAVPANIAASAAVGPATPTGWAVLSGVSVAETAGTATRIEIRDQQSATGNVCCTIQIPANGSTPFAELPNVRIAGGAYVKVIGAGTLVGSIFLR